jgi:AraC-like DNA-binding protein
MESRLNRIQWEAEGGVRLDLLGFVRFPEGHRGVGHFHRFWELIYIGDGSGQLHHDAGAFACAAGEIILVPPGETHRFQADANAPLDQLYLGFSFDFALADPLASSPPRPLPMGPFADLIRSELAENLARLRDKDPGVSMETVRGRLLAVVSRVIGFLIASEGRSSSSEKDRPSPVLLAKEFLHSDLKSSKGVPDLARRFCLSPQYFGEIFKRDTGVSIKEYQRDCRMEKAMSLLREGNLTITEVAAEVGLDDLAYFSRLFKRKFGIPPRQAKPNAPARLGRHEPAFPRR